MHFSNHLDTANGPPLPPLQTLLRWTNTFCLGARRKGGKIKAYRVNSPKNFGLHCRPLVNGNSNGMLEG